MASLQQMKNRLRSIELSGQLANVMKTVASAKYAKLNRIYSEYRHHAEKSQTFGALCEGAAGELLSSPDPNAPALYILLTHKRGMCGGYNAELQNFAVSFFKETYPEAALLENASEKDRSLGKKFLIAVNGPRAATFLKEKKIPVAEELNLPEIPDAEFAHQFLSDLKKRFQSGEVSSVSLIYQQNCNTLLQKPTVRKLLPYSAFSDDMTEKKASDPGRSSRQENKTHLSPDDILWVPDRETCMKAFLTLALDSAFFSIFLEAAVGAQSATLFAMRTASDHAKEAAAVLHNDINKMRQSAVTAAVLETSSDQSQEGDEL